MSECEACGAKATCNRRGYALCRACWNRPGRVEVVVREGLRARIATLEAALAERDRELQSCRTELDEAREKVDLLMQPVPEVHGDFPWQMMRLWCSNYALEKRRWREDVAERERRVAELEAEVERQALDKENSDE